MKKFNCTLKNTTYGKQYNAMLVKTNAFDLITFEYLYEEKKAVKTLYSKDMKDFTIFADNTANFYTERLDKEGNTVIELWQVEKLKEIEKMK